MVYDFSIQTSFFPGDFSLSCLPFFQLHQSYTMTFFPTRYSTLSAPALGTFIMQQYGIADVYCRYKLRGVSDTYHVQSAAGEFILKIFRSMHRTEEELLGEIALLEYLIQNDIRVAAPVKDLSGNILQSFRAIEGIRHGILYHFAPGAPIIEQNDEQIVLSAQYLARFHLTTENLELPYNRKAYTLETMLWEPLQAILPAFEGYDYQEGYTVLKDLSVTIVQNLDKLNTAAFSTGYCHYDFMPKNWHHDAQGIITLFDFDFAGKGWLVNDIASYAVYLSLLNPGTKEIKDKLDLFIRSYTDVRPLQPDEMTAIPELSLLFCIFYLKYQYENQEDHTNNYFGPRFLRERIRHFQFINEVLK